MPKAGWSFGPLSTGLIKPGEDRAMISDLGTVEGRILERI